MWPGFDEFEPAATLAVLSVICLDVHDLASRALKLYISTVSVTAYAFAASVIAGLLLIPTGRPLLRTDGSQIG